MQTTADITSSPFWTLSSLFLVIADQEGNILHANPFAEKLVDRQPLSGHFNDLLIAFNSQEHWSRIQSGGEDRHLMSLNRNEKPPVSLFFSGTPLKDGFLVIGEQDLFEMFSYQTKFLEVYQELNLVSRTLQKTNAELAEKNHQINSFLGMAAHDMRNPIGVILNYADYLRDEYGQKLDPFCLDFLDRMISTAEFLLRLLDNLLDVVKVQDGYLTLKRSEVDLIQFIRENMARNLLLAKKKSIDIRFIEFPNRAHSKVDPDKMEQVLNNLISNAVKYSESGSVVEVSLNQTETQYILKVRDEGIGMKKDQIDQIFKEFGTIEKSGTAGEKSIGLGLFIVKRIVEAHKGRISVESTFGSGSTFIVEWPK